MKLGNKRVHIAFQGYERERIYKPAIDNDADVVVLVVHDEDKIKSSSEDQSEINKPEKCYNEVTRELTSQGIKVEKTECDFFDLNSAVLAIGDIVTRYDSKDSEIYLNVSTGSKITAIAGAIAGTATSAEPYYVRAETYEGEQIAEDIRDLQKLPQYPFQSPHLDFLHVLEFIQNQNEEGSYVIKKDIVRFCKDLSLLEDHQASELRYYYSPTEEKVISPLKDWGYINVQPRGDEKRYTLSEQGQEVLSVLRFLLE